MPALEAALVKHGVVIASEKALQVHSPAISEFRGRAICGSVRFMDMEYRFDRVMERPESGPGPRELSLDPGLVYITD